MTLNEFEYRRQERRNRERLRKKRIRIALLIIVIIGIVILGCIAISSMSKIKSEADNYNANANNTVVSQDNPDEIQDNPDAEIPQDTASDGEIPREAGKIPESAEENNILQILTDSGQTKHCYLTFDDGPTDSITPQILDILRRYNIKATFFEVGSLIEANPDMARRVYEEGHLIANHSDSHNYDKLYATEESFMTEINDCYNKIKSVTNGEEPFKLIRFPGGSYDAGDHAAQKQVYKNSLAQNGFYYCDWNTLTGDAEGRTKNASELLAYLQSTMLGYNNIVVLMHDSATKQATADALPSVIEYIRNQGYTFHRLDDIQYQLPQAEETPAEEIPAEDTPTEE